MQKLFEEYKMCITPLTPIHIGSGEELMPGEYFVFQDNGRYKLYRIDMGYLASKLTDKSRDNLCNMIAKDPIKWVDDAARKDSLVELIRKYAWFYAVVNNDVADGVRERWGKNDSMLAIKTLQRTGQDPIIPGSSIKGAIRTALLWSLVKKPLELPETLLQFNDKSHHAKVTSWERRDVLKSQSSEIQDDLLRHLKIADCKARGLVSRILVTDHVGMSDKRGKQSAIIDYRECFPGELQLGRNYNLETSLVIASGHPHYLYGRVRITSQLILKACRDFYLKVLEADKDYWEKQGRNDILGICERIEQVFKELPEDKGALIKLGWGGGMDSISLNLAKRDGKHPPGRINPQFRYNPKTRRLLGGYPPGWAVLKLEKV